MMHTINTKNGKSGMNKEQEIINAIEDLKIQILEFNKRETINNLIIKMRGTENEKSIYKNKRDRVNNK